MNSKERAMTAVARGRPDRVPLDFSANAATLQRLHVDLQAPTHMDLLRRLHVDMVDLRGVVDPVYCGPIPKEQWLAGGVKQNYLRIADDLGTQHGLLISPAMFDRIFAPRLARLVDMAHSHGVKVMFHSCGAIVPFIERIIALDIDVLDPIQVAADGMDPQVIKTSFGQRICLHGSIDTQFVLPRGQPSDVGSAVRSMIDTLGVGGGFILAPTHVLQTDVPTANVLALYDTAYEYGIYKP